METSTAGTFYIVATPIGNLKDITQRAIETLEKVDWIACEDTRHSQKLLQHLGIKKPLIALHDHNEAQQSEVLLDKLQKGENGALISDAGTPLISDPGYHLVKLLRQQQVTVTPIPGASAIITALSAAGLPTDRFTFEGFLPAKQQKRLQVLESLMDEPRTMVFYESPHRLMDSLQALVTVMGEGRELVVARELTKQFEAFVTGTTQTALDYFTERPSKIRGEFVLILAGAQPCEEATPQEWDELIGLMLEEGMPVKQIASLVAKYFGVKKNAVYARVLSLKL
jgi:16S rRNA (cytidine1402-2'-O)-methyltransferase